MNITSKLKISLSGGTAKLKQKRLILKLILRKKYPCHRYVLKADNRRFFLESKRIYSAFNFDLNKIRPYPFYPLNPCPIKASRKLRLNLHPHPFPRNRMFKFQNLRMKMQAFSTQPIQIIPNNWCIQTISMSGMYP